MDRENLASTPLAGVAKALEDRLDQIIDGMIDAVVREVPFYRSAVVSRRDLDEGLRGSVAFVLSELAHQGTRPVDVTAPSTTGRKRAVQGAPLADVLHCYRLSFTYFWEQLLHEAQRTGEETAAALLTTASRIWALADAYSTALTDSYRDAIAEHMLETDRRRSALVSALIDGQTADGEAVWEIARLLGFPPQGRFVVAVAEAVAVGEPPLPGLESHLRALDVGSAWRAQPGQEIGILSLPPYNTESAVLDAFRACATGRVGLSPVYARLDQTRRTLRYAQVALDSLPQGAGAVRQLDDAPLTDLVLANLDSTRRAVNRVLGGLLCLPDNERTTLLATAQAWLRAHGSAAEAAQALYCHPNTVRYRLRRLEEHLRGPLEDPLILGELAVALDAVGTFPDLLHEHRGDDLPSPVRAGDKSRTSP